MDYVEDVLEEAVSFLEEQEDEIKEAIKEDEDFYDIDNCRISDSFHESVIDRGYTPEDAVYILQHCENEETDRGLWEGLDWSDELSARAAFSYGNDVLFKAEELYNDLRDRYQSTTEDEKTIDDIWNDFVEEHTIKPIEEVGSREELELLKQWLAMGKEAGLWGGYPLGSSYIDARCGSGHGMPYVKDFVDFDHEVAKKLPHMNGKYQDAVEKRVEELKKRCSSEVTKDFSSLEQSENNL